MSLVVRHKDTGCYLQGQGLWTQELEGAMQFNSGLRLVDYVEHGGVGEKPEQIEVVVIPAVQNDLTAISGSNFPH